MSALALRFLNHCGKRAQVMTAYKILRMSSTDEPCSSKPPECCEGKQEPCPPKQPEPSNPKPEPCPQQPKLKVCSEPPPCPTMPRCPPTLCPTDASADRNNPCNYCPPQCIDPDYPDLTRLKKNQCFFQQDNGLPVFLKRGKVDAFLFQFVLIMLLLCLAASFYSTVKIMK